MYTFDVDGYLTNSRLLVNNLNQYAPTEFVLLAADPLMMMKTNETITKEWDAIYVGAGGPMLYYKPKLYNMLKVASRYKLRLHGTGWDEVDSLKPFWQGTLPRDDLGNAYASARIVLASTIEAQSAYGMINNRIFEGLSSGSVVLSHYSNEIYELFGDIIILSNEDNDIPNLIDNILNDPSKQERLGRLSREIIINKHTWDHRAVQILDLFWNIRNQMQSYKEGSLDLSSSSSSSSLSSNIFNKRRNGKRSKLVWVVSDYLKYHLDYIMIIKRFVFQALAQNYDITIISEHDWVDKISNNNNTNNNSDNNNDDDSNIFINSFDIIMIIASPCDDLHMSMNSYKHRLVHGIIS